MPSRTRVCSVNYDQSSIDNSTICPKSDLLRVTKVALFVKAIAAILIASCCNPFCAILDRGDFLRQRWDHFQ